MDFDELDGFTEEKALMILRARELKKQINELRGRIAEENQNILDDEEWVMTPGLPQISQNEIYKDIANYKINVVFYERQLQQLQEQLKEIEALLVIIMPDLNNFLEYLSKELNYSENTEISYREDITNFLNYLGKNNIDYKFIDGQIIRDYLKYLDDAKLKNSTIARRICALRTFYNYLLNKNIIDTNLFNSIRNPKLDKKLPNYLSYEELAKILNNIDTSTKMGLRNRLLVEMFYATGCRLVK